MFYYNNHNNNNNHVKIMKPQNESGLYASFCVNDLNFDANPKLKNCLYQTENGMYHIINYDKKMLCNDERESTTNYRSVIYSSPEMYLLSYSPPRSISIDSFAAKYPMVNDSIFANEMIEGMMIHLFYDFRIQKWEIATKSKIGYANNKILVNQMFLEALRIPLKTGFNNYGTNELFSKRYCYIFILQHPSHLIVVPVETPALYLVAVYDINSYSHRAISIPQVVYQEWDCFVNLNGIIRFPEIYDNLTFNTYFEYSRTFGSIQNSHKSMGVMITNLETGERCSMRNPVYHEFVKIRKQSTELQYQYLCLQHIDKTPEFLIYFPHFKSAFFNFYKQYKQFVENIHFSYMSQYVYKTKEMISPKYLPYIQKIHKEIYLPSLRTRQKTVISSQVVRDFMNQLSPDEILYALNYERRNFANSFSL